MIKQYTPSQLFQLYSQTPADVQDAAISEQTSQRLRNIVLVKHKLFDENLVTTAQLLGLVLFGLLHPDELAANFQKELSIEPARAKALYQDIWETILKPIEASLRRIHGPVKAVEEVEIEAEFKPAPAPIKPPTMAAGPAPLVPRKIEAPPVRPMPPVPSKVEMPPEKFEAPAPSRVEAPVKLAPPPIRPSAPPIAEAPKADIYREIVEEKALPAEAIKKPEKEAPTKPEVIEIGGIPAVAMPRPGIAEERPAPLPPRALYIEPIEDEETPPNIVDLRGK